MIVFAWVFAVRHEQAYRWVPLDSLDTPPTADKDEFLGVLRKGLDAHDTRVVTGRGEDCDVWEFVWGGDMRAGSAAEPPKFHPLGNAASAFASALASLPPVAPGGSNSESWPPQPPDKRRWRPRARGRRACALGVPQLL